MGMPFYVSPEQIIADKVKFARNGISKGRSLVAMQYADGILLTADNPSRMLHKISEIYDRIAFAGVGKYNEFDSLRQAGVRHADLKGFQYAREDVDARSLANLYGQLLGKIFTHEMKPYEVEILVAEVGYDAAGDELYQILYDGIVVDQEGFAVLGGEAETITQRVKDTYQEGADLQSALRTSVAALAGTERTMTPADLEVATLARTNGRRAFRRVEDEELAQLLG